jgi:hypothetical protein
MIMRNQAKSESICKKQVPSSPRIELADTSPSTVIRGRVLLISLESVSIGWRSSVRARARPAAPSRVRQGGFRGRHIGVGRHRRDAGIDVVVDYLAHREARAHELQVEEQLPSRQRVIDHAVRQNPSSYVLRVEFEPPAGAHQLREQLVRLRPRSILA